MRLTEPIPLMRRGLTYTNLKTFGVGVQRFMNEVAPKEPLEIPDLDFSTDENQRMDEPLKQECEASANVFDINLMSINIVNL